MTTAKAPIVNATKVMVTATRVAKSTALVFFDATVIGAVKVVQASRNAPTPPAPAAFSTSGLVSGH